MAIDRAAFDVPAQEKLDWVTPKISLMGAGDTEGNGKNGSFSTVNNPYRPIFVGPS